MENLKKNVFDNQDVIVSKNNKIDSYIKLAKETLYDRELHYINDIVTNLTFILPRENFSGKNGVYLYSFEYKDKDREVYISPDVYLIEGDCVVYEVVNHKKYFQVTTNKILISQSGKYFCEIPLKQFLTYVSAEDISTCLDKHINLNYSELANIQKRIDYLNSEK